MIESGRWRRKSSPNGEKRKERLQRLGDCLSGDWGLIEKISGLDQHLIEEQSVLDQGLIE